MNKISFATCLYDFYVCAVQLRGMNPGHDQKLTYLLKPKLIYPELKSMLKQKKRLCYQWHLTGQAKVLKVWFLLTSVSVIAKIA